MAIVTSRELVLDAQARGYCVPAINTQGGNYDIIRAICEAAEDAGSPMILAQYAANIHYYGMEWFAQVARFWANKVSVPVAVHLDHATTFDQVEQALKYGFTSVMIDGSTERISANAEITRKVIQAAHAVGASVEAEVGELSDINKQDENSDRMAAVGDVEAFLEACQPDLLAVGIGNAHGFYKGAPNIRLDILQDIRAVTDIPLVMHGATGIPEETIKASIRVGIAKINFGTLVRYKYFEYYKEAIEKMDHQFMSWKVALHTKDRLKGVIRDIITLSGSEGR